MIEHTLGAVARLLDARLDGDADRRLTGMAPLEQAGPHDLCYAASAELAEQVAQSNAGGVIVGEDFPVLSGCHLVRVAGPREAFHRALELFAPDHPIAGIHPSAVVSADARLEDGVGVGPLAVIEAGARVGAGTRVSAGAYIGHDVVVGRDCRIGVNAALLHGTRVGERCILHPGVVLGSDGYGYQWDGQRHRKIAQIGVVVLEDDVELGGNTCIDRATIGETRIGLGSKLDNLVHVAHNCQFGRHVLLTGQVAVAGSTRLGDGVVAGGQAGISDHLDIGDGVQIGAQGGVIGDVAAGERVWGTPARPMNRVLREQAALARLPALLRQVGDQQRLIEALSDRIAALESGTTK